MNKNILKSIIENNKNKIIESIYIFIRSASECTDGLVKSYVDVSKLEAMREYAFEDFEIYAYLKYNLYRSFFNNVNSTTVEEEIKFKKIIFNLNENILDKIFDLKNVKIFNLNQLKYGYKLNRTKIYSNDYY